MFSRSDENRQCAPHLKRHRAACSFVRSDGGCSHALLKPATTLCSFSRQPSPPSLPILLSHKISSHHRPTLLKTSCRPNCCLRLPFAQGYRILPLKVPAAHTHPRQPGPASNNPSSLLTLLHVVSLLNRRPNPTPSLTCPGD